MQIKTKLLSFNSFSARGCAPAATKVVNLTEPRSSPAEGLTRSLPRSDEFVDLLDRQIGLTYDQTMDTISKALRRAGANPKKLIEFGSSTRARACFLMGCCAEELASIDYEYRTEITHYFLRDVISDLRPRVRPIVARRVPIELRKLIADFKSYPVRCRSMTVQYMLSSCGEADLASMLRSDAASQLIIELTVLHDGVSGMLRQLIEQACQIERLPAGDPVRPATAMGLAMG